MQFTGPFQDLGCFGEFFGIGAKRRDRRWRKELAGIIRNMNSRIGGLAWIRASPHEGWEESAASGESGLNRLKSRTSRTLGRLRAAASANGLSEGPVSRAQGSVSAWLACALDDTIALPLLGPNM